MIASLASSRAEVLFVELIPTLGFSLESNLAWLVAIEHLLCTATRARKSMVVDKLCW
jgi:hypothetical protein